MAKAATIVADEREQEPLAGSPDLGWWVLNATMMAGLIALAGVALYACVKMAITIFSVF